MSPVYTFHCPTGHTFDRRVSGYDDACSKCPECDDVGVRRSFYLEQTVTGLPTRAPLLPPRPGPRSSKGESADTAGEMMDEFAHKSYQWDRRYAAGGEYAEGPDWTARARSKRES